MFKVVEEKLGEFFEEKCFINDEVFGDDIVEIVFCWMGIFVIKML